MAQITLRGVRLAFGGPPVLDGVDLRIESGERICLLGRNGEGKTSLLRLLAGDETPDAGELVRAPGLRVAMLCQEIPEDLSGTALAVAAKAGPNPDITDHEVERALDLVGMDPTADVSELSTGQKRRVLLAAALAADPDVLILDEPTNHLDIPAIRRLESLLLRRHATLVFVTHDRELLRRLAGRILELDRGTLRDWTCDYDTFLRRRDEDLISDQKRRAEFDRRLAEEEVWIRQGVQARRTRNEGRVRRLMALRDERAARRNRIGAADFDISSAERSGRLVLRAEGASVGYGGDPVIRDLDCTILRGDRVGIVGPNGAGKTTLLRLLLGELGAESGTIRQGTNLEIVYFDQRREQLDASKTVQENVADGHDHVIVDGRSVHVLTWLQRFLFTPDRARSPITRLSGGERNRLLLARLFTRRANLLVLDEPTNDLDLETLELLEEILGDYAGTLLLVSHDRAFLENVVTSTLVLDGTGRVTESAGGWRDWERLEATVSEKKPSKPPQGTPKARRERTQRLSFKERSELETLPARIESLEAELAGIRDRLADPELYKQGGDAVMTLSGALEAREAELETAYARWEALEAIRENE